MCLDVFFSYGESAPERVISRARLGFGPYIPYLYSFTGLLSEIHIPPFVPLNVTALRPGLVLSCFSILQLCCVSQLMHES